MANKKSKSEIKKIHINLINELIEGHVSDRPDAKTYKRWKGEFKKHCNQTAQHERSVKENFDYLEETRQVTPGDYALLEDIFSRDHEAIEKIKEAEYEIKRISIEESMQRGKNPVQVTDHPVACGNPEEPKGDSPARRMTLAKVVVPINMEQHDTGIKISVIFGDFIKDLQLPEYNRRRSPIEKGYEIVHGRGDWTSDLGRSVRTAQNRLVDNLRTVCSDNIANAVQSIFKYWFDLLHMLENDYDLFVCRVGWERSIVIVLESGTSFARTPWTSEVESHIRDIFSTIGQRGVVNNVTVVTLSATEVRRLYDKFDSDRTTNYYKIEVGITNSQHSTAERMILTFRDLIRDLQRILNGTSPIEEGYRIVHDGEYRETSFGIRVQEAQNKLVDMLRGVCSDNIMRKSNIVLEIWFDLLRYLERTCEMSVCGIGWENSIVLVVKTGTSFDQKNLKLEVRSRFRELFSTIGQGDDVVNLVSLENLSSSDADSLITRLNRRVI